MITAVSQPLTETQGWFLVVEGGIIALILLIRFVMARQ